MDEKPSSALKLFGQFVEATYQLDTVDALYQAAVNFVPDLIAADRSSVTVCLRELAMTEVRAVYVRGEAQTQIHKGERLPIKGGLDAYLERASKPEIWSPQNPRDNGDSVIEMISRMRFKSVLNVPMLTSDGLVGTLNAATREKQYSAEDLYLLQQLAALVSASASRITSYADVEASSRRHRLYATHLEQLNQVAEHLTLSSTIDAAMELVAT